MKRLDVIRLRARTRRVCPVPASAWSGCAPGSGDRQMQVVAELPGGTLA